MTNRWAICCNSFAIFLFFGVLQFTHPRVFERCELGYTLVAEGIFLNDWDTEIPTWLCLVNWTSSFDTDYYLDGEDPDYGIFGIDHWACMDYRLCGFCDGLREPNITNSVTCLKAIWSSDTEWRTWNAWKHCNETRKVNPYIYNCTEKIEFHTCGGLMGVEEYTEGFTMACTATGYPPPTLSWEWDEQGDLPHIIQTSNLTDVFYNTYLTFETVYRNDTRNYTCVASNSEETLGKVYSLSVEYVEDPTTTTEKPTTSTEPPTTTETATTIELTSSTEVSTTTTLAESSTQTTEIAVSPPPFKPSKALTACDVARILTVLYNDTYDWNENLDSWLCLSDKTTEFNTSFFEVSNGRVYYGIFKISNEWCLDYVDEGNPCGISCTDLFAETLNGTVACSKQIYDTNGFSEWPEYEKMCEGQLPNYLQWCTEPPYFVWNEDEETERTFEEYSQEEKISCSAQGFPPPKIEWDTETITKVLFSNGRLSILPEREIEGNGENVTVKTTLIFHTVHMEDMRDYHCYASNIAGEKSRDYKVKVIKAKKSNSTLFYGGISIVSLLLLASLILLLLLFRARKKRKQALERLYKEFMHGTDPSLASWDSATFSSYLSDTEIYGKPFNKKFEIPSNSLQIYFDVVLGSGAFGIVFQGIFHNTTGSHTVAVKTLPKGANESLIASLLSEIKILSYAGRHPNLVEFIGAQTMNLRQGIVFVVMEYCSNGSLESILKANRQQMRNQLYYGGQMNQTVVLPGYLSQTEKVNKPFSRYQLLQFCQDVCSGMEYLEFKKIIHGDLSARNVLVTNDFVCKITDFGLSKRLYENYSTYSIADKNTPLPWRWLAIETLKDLRFSTESDIWAFGIFMWEVFSLAELPYSTGISWSSEFVTYLEQGFRLSKPLYSSVEIYALMKECWKAEPFHRIKFIVLIEEIVRLQMAEPNKR